MASLNPSHNVFSTDLNNETIFSDDENGFDSTDEDTVPSNRKKGEFVDIDNPISIDIAQDKIHRPIQPVLAKHLLLADKHGKTFQVAWYTGRSWLEYSISKSRAFCFCCRHFPNAHNRTSMVWARDGFLVGITVKVNH